MTSETPIKFDRIALIFLNIVSIGDLKGNVMDWNLQIENSRKVDSDFIEQTVKQ